MDTTGVRPLYSFLLKDSPHQAWFTAGFRPSCSVDACFSALPRFAQNPETSVPVAKKRSINGPSETKKIGSKLSFCFGATVKLSSSSSELERVLQGISKNVT